MKTVRDGSPGRVGELAQVPLVEFRMDVIITAVFQSERSMTDGRGAEHVNPECYGLCISDRYRNFMWLRNDGKC
jgi:hypothetical protein